MSANRRENEFDCHCMEAVEKWNRKPGYVCWNCRCRAASDRHCRFCKTGLFFEEFEELAGLCETCFSKDKDV